MEQVELFDICRSCGEQPAISKLTHYCRSCQNERVKRYNNKKLEKLYFINDEWLERARQVNGKIMTKYANKWKVG